MLKQSRQMIYWSQYEGKLGSFYLAATERGLCFMGSPDEDIKELKIWAQKHFQDAKLIRSDETLAAYRKEYEEYFTGGRRTFTIAEDRVGTVFQKKVWEALTHIPYGTTCTYSDIADMIQKPTAVRAVAAAIGQNPLLITVPCHRVIGKNGSLTGFRAGLKMKKQLLELERFSSVDGPDRIKI